jgi:hypothetical protein
LFIRRGSAAFIIVEGANRTVQTLGHGIEAIGGVGEPSREQETGENSEDEAFKSVHFGADFAVATSGCQSADYRNFGMPTGWPVVLPVIR